MRGKMTKVSKTILLITIVSILAIIFLSCPSSALGQVRDTVTIIPIDPIEYIKEIAPNLDSTTVISALLISDSIIVDTPTVVTVLQMDPGALYAAKIVKNGDTTYSFVLEYNSNSFLFLDRNHDGLVNVLDTMDVNHDKKGNLLDVVWIINRLYRNK
jgi:hypothetical protein